MTIRTNRLNIHFNIPEIVKDFAFIRFTRECKGGWNGAAQLDQLIGNEYNACAVMFQYGKYAYAMFRRPIETYELLSKIRCNQDFAHDAVIEVPAKATRDEATDCICEAWLAQILLNSLSSSRSRFSKFHFCNLTGSLLLIPDYSGKQRDFIDAAKVSVSSDYLMEVKIIRHRKKISVLSELKNAGDSRKNELRKALDGPCYQIHESTGRFRRVLPRDEKIDSKLSYVPCGVFRQKASIPFLEFGSYNKFVTSRAGILHTFLKDIKSYLSKYMQVESISREFNHCLDLTGTIMKKPHQLLSKLDNIPMRIVDCIGNEESAELTRTLKKGLAPYVSDQKQITIGKKDKVHTLNFRIIHDAAYYEDNGLKDEYLPSTDDYHRQHLTFEDSNLDIHEAMVKTLIKEQLIKRDIAQGQLSIFDWCKIDATKVWTFAACDKKANRFVFMDIKPDGSFDFRELDGTDIFDLREYQQYIDYLESAKKDEWKSGLTIEGLVASEDGDINLIFRTNEITLPQLEEIEAIIREVDKELPLGKRTGFELAKLVDTFANRQESTSDKLNSFSKDLKKFGNDEMQKNQFRKLLNEQLGKNTKLATSLRDYLLFDHAIRLSFPKQRERLETLFDATLNIKYFGETEREAFYCVGDRRENIQFSFKDACHLRKIIAVNGSKLIFKKLLPTMNVDFVRTGQSTVIPFPFKYLREYMKLTHPSLYKS
jgi:hypothetical protein